MNLLNNTVVHVNNNTITVENKNFTYSLTILADIKKEGLPKGYKYISDLKSTYYIDYEIILEEKLKNICENILKSFVN